MAIHHFIPWSEAILPPRQTLVSFPSAIGGFHQLPRPEIIWIDETPSTHTLLKQPEYLGLKAYTMLCARRQTAGRGQRGNSWESEPYMNLTFSMPFFPEGVSPAAQFILSEGFALSVVALLQEVGIQACVKWPNDIYVGEEKICGILIEHSLEGAAISRTILSAGLNVNQTDFKSDAPNPTSMLRVLRRLIPDHPELDLNRLACRLLQIIREMMEATKSAAGREAIHAAYMKHLFRNDGKPHRYRINSGRDSAVDPDAPGKIMQGIIEDVAPDGVLTLRLFPAYPDQAGAYSKSFYFKEISHLPDSPDSPGYAAGI